MRKPKLAADLAQPDRDASNVIQLFQSNSITALRQASGVARLTDPDGSWKRSGFCLAPHENVRVSVSSWRNQGARVTHVGTFDELLACGAVTPKIAAQLEQKQRGKVLCDENGARFRILRKPSKTCPDRLCIQRWAIDRGEQALTLPGVRQLFRDGLFLAGDEEDSHGPKSVLMFTRSPTGNQKCDALVKNDTVTAHREASFSDVDAEFYRLMLMLDENQKARVLSFMEGLMAARPKQ